MNDEFKGEKMKKITGLIIIAILVFTVFTWVSCGGAGKKIAPEPYNDEFYEKTRLIMLKNEARVYRHLPDRAAREDFIEEFWKKRDPTPGTGENENKMEFERRIEFVDRFFKEQVGSGRGWETDRGKIYVLLGAPDERTTGQGNTLDRFGQLKRVLKEIWVYNNYRLYLEFIDRDELGVYRLRSWNMDLLRAIEQAKFKIYREKDEEAELEWLRFKPSFENNELILLIPGKHIIFDEKENRMIARFKINLYIYHNYKKVDEMEVTRDVSDSKDAFLNKKNIRLTIPYTLSSRGRYLFDIILKDMISGSSSREMLNYKY
jgi:GWxTD domain-containing protein